MTNPCRDCQHHAAECHASCEEYAAWSKAHRAARERDAQRRAVDEIAIRNALRIKDKRKKRG